MSTAQQHLVTSQDELTELYGAPDEAVKVKAIPQLDEHCRAFIALSPFVTVATVGEDGTCDASPRGGVPGFCDVVGPGTPRCPTSPATGASTRSATSSPRGGSGSCSSSGACARRCA